MSGFLLLLDGGKAFAFFADAVLFGTTESSFTADAAISDLRTASFTADAILKTQYAAPNIEVIGTGWYFTTETTAFAGAAFNSGMVPAGLQKGDYLLVVTGVRNSAGAGAPFIINGQGLSFTALSSNFAVGGVGKARAFGAFWDGIADIANINAGNNGDNETQFSGVLYLRGLDPNTPVDVAWTGVTNSLTIDPPTSVTDSALWLITVTNGITSDNFAETDPLWNSYTTTETGDNGAMSTHVFWHTDTYVADPSSFTFTGSSNNIVIYGVMRANHELPKGTFTADAVISSAPSSIFSADAVLLGIVESNFVADSVILFTTVNSFTSDAILLATIGAGVTPTVVRASQSSGGSADSTALISVNNPTDGDNLALYAFLITSPGTTPTGIRYDRDGTNPASPVDMDLVSDSLFSFGVDVSGNDDQRARLVVYRILNPASSTTGGALVGAQGVSGATGKIAAVLVKDVYQPNPDIVVDTDSAQSSTASYGPFGVDRNLLLAVMGWGRWTSPNTSVPSNTGSQTTAIAGSANNGFGQADVGYAIGYGDVSHSWNIFESKWWGMVALQVNTLPPDLTFTADAEFASGVLVVSDDFTADAIIKSTNIQSFDADSIIKGTVPVGFTASSIILGTHGFSFGAFSILRRTETDDFAADALIEQVVSDSWVADSILLGTATALFTAGAILADTRTDSFTSDSIIGTTVESSFTADSSIVIVVVGDFAADAVLLLTAQSIFSANAIILVEAISGFTADAVLFQITYFGPAEMTAANDNLVLSSGNSIVNLGRLRRSIRLTRIDN